jgi:hypothetical protein
MKIIKSLSFVCALMLFSLQPGIASAGDAPQADNLTMMKPAANNAAGDDLSPFQIFQKTREKYASLTSYSDEGQAVVTLNDAIINTSFTIRLARTNFYMIEWKQTVESILSTNYDTAQSVWSSSAGNFLDTGLGPQNEESRETALAKARENSGGAAITIPRIFFNLPWGDPFGDAWFAHDRQTDENVGGVDCYVLNAELQGQTRTFWIGKQDFLIRQARTVTSADVLQEMMAKHFYWDWEQISGIQNLTMTETHTHIIVNKPFTRSDFIPSNGE